MPYTEKLGFWHNLWLNNIYLVHCYAIEKTAGSNWLSYLALTTSYNS